MYTRWLYTHMNNPMKNIEVRHYKCGQYYAREFLTTRLGKYILDIFPLRRITKGELMVLIENYMLYDCEVIEGENHENK